MIGFSVYSRQFGAYRKTKVCGIVIQKKSIYDKLCRKLCKQLSPDHRIVFMLPYNIGETYVFLSHYDKWLKGNASDIQVVVWKKSHIPLYKMFIPKNILIKSVDIDSTTVFDLASEKPILFDGFTLHFSEGNIAEVLKKEHEQNKANNFYTHFLTKLGVSQSIPHKPNVSENVRQHVDDILTELKMKKKFVILCPEATTLSAISPSFWERISTELIRKGYDVFINSDKFSFPGTKFYKTHIDTLYELVCRSSGVVSLASGLSVFLTAANKTMDLIYTDFKDINWGYTSTVAIEIYSVMNIDNVSKFLIKEYDLRKESLDEIYIKILNRYKVLK